MNDKIKKRLTIRLRDKEKQEKMKDRSKRGATTSSLESWFKSGSKKGTVAARPNSQSYARPTSETDFGDMDEADLKIQYERQIHQMDEKEINEKFENLLNDMNLNEDKKQPLRQSNLDNKKKMLIMQYKGSIQESKSKFDKPQQIIEYLNNYLRPEVMSSSKILNCVESLRIALTNNTLSWVSEFGNHKGLDTILRVLTFATEKSNSDSKFEKVQMECLRSILKFTNNTEGIKTFLRNEQGHEVVANCLDYKKPSVTIPALQILSALCFLSDDESNIVGMDRALSSITKVSEKKNYNERFAPIVSCITETDHKDLWSMCLQFINALLSNTDDFEFRMHLRNEIVRNGLYDKLDKLREETFPDVQTQYNVFEQHKDEDSDELHSRFDNVRLDIDDVNDCFEVLKNTTLDTAAEPYFLSILQHLLFIRDEFNIRPAYYKLIEECVSQIVLHKSGLDPDFSKKHFHIDFSQLLEELKEKPEDKAKYEELKKQLDEAIGAKEEALAKVKMLEERGVSGVSSSSTGKLDPNIVGNIASKVVGPPPPPMPGGGPPPPPMPGMGPPPPPMPGLGGPPPPPMPGMAGMPGLPPPPPLPGMGGPPPPPPPGMGGMGPPPPPGMGPPPPFPGGIPMVGMTGPDVLPFGLKPKKKWETSGPLKKANWKTIIPHKLTEKSFWVKVQEEKLASPDILDGLAQRFSSKPAKKMDDVVDKVSNSGTLKKRELKVLDGKSAQNISILLGGSLKHMSYDEIKKCILRCDNKALTESVLEQLINYLPPPEQLNKFQQFKDSYAQLTEAEQFCYKIAEIKRLLPRLKSLIFRQHYTEMVGDIKPDIVATTAACEEVKKSRKFAKILELILLLGNYMNSGSRNAQAFGFEMSFLTKLTSTKDAYNKKTLLHYIVETAENKFPDILNFYDELPHIDKASKVSLETIQKTLKEMENKIKNLLTDVANNKVPQNEDDKFLEVMEKFANEAREQCQVLRNMFDKVEGLYGDLAEYYCFEKTKYTLEEFFTDLKTFKDSFIEARKDNEKERELEEKTRKAKLAKEKADKERQEREARKRAIIDMNPSETQEGVMDSLLQALQTGSAFSREQKRKRTPRPAGAERRANLQRSRSRTNVIAGRELTSEIMT